MLLRRRSLLGGSASALSSSASAAASAAAVLPTRRRHSLTAPLAQIRSLSHASKPTQHPTPQTKPQTPQTDDHPNGASAAADSMMQSLSRAAQLLAAAQPQAAKQAQQAAKQAATSISKQGQATSRTMPPQSAPSSTPSSSYSTLLSTPPLPAPFPPPRYPLHPSSAPHQPLPESNQTIDSYFGSMVFDRRTMKKYLSQMENDKFVQALQAGRSIDYATADAIANALLRWATERGATHFTHWFQPITGTVAEKHDTFLDTLRDGETPLIRFTGKQLIMGEPDGSSFPSGGLRATHVARGYTAWDPHSPPFILQHNNGATLYIPSCFFSWDKGYALDEKIPLLRSEAALARESMRLFQVLGDNKHTSVHMDAGLEQEFFLIDRQYFLERPDLMLCGRTVVGAAPPKGQEMDDSYFAPISTRFLDCIHELEITCWKLGIPIQTRHREVAPGQYEIAPKFAPADVGTDRNLLIMELLKRIARKHNLAALLHEKPFAGVNGSGKHNNWSLGTNDCPSLLDPGRTPEKNPRFMLFLAATLRAVDLHADLMRVAVSGVGNDHRLGAHEAPPAIVSAYLGDDIEKSLERFIGGSEATSEFNTLIDLGIRTLPDLRRVPTDRNRTSTFAFTGNKFEFRAVGSSHNPARSNTIVNTIVAQSVRYFADEIEKRKAAGVEVGHALRDVTREVLKAHKRIVFNGNGYSEEWAKEAERRGLPNYKSTPQALETFYSQKNIQLFESMRVLTRQELQSRSHIFFEDYTKRLSAEARVMASIIKTRVSPVAFKYQKRVSESISHLESVAGKDTAKPQRQLLSVLTGALNTSLTHSDRLLEVIEAAQSQSTPGEQAHYCEKHLLPLMKETREAVDKLESLIGEKEWPLPTYQQMLFRQD